MSEKLFFELISVSIGTQETLSHLPSAREWGELYKMAAKQSLVAYALRGFSDSEQMPMMGLSESA